MPNTVAVVLGRTGDIINALPCIKHYADLEHRQIPVVVSRAFADVLEGCSYVKPYPVDLPYEKLGAGLQYAKQQFGGRLHNTNILRLQAWGTDVSVTHTNKSFCTDVWAWAGLPYGSLPVCFDNRDSKREAALVDSVLPKSGKPIILINLAGTSGALHEKDKVYSLIASKIGDGFELVDLSKVKAERFYDLLALYERARSLITIDTATLHLAAAVHDLPVITLIPDRAQPWCVAPWRSGHIKRILYSEIENRIDEIVQSAMHPRFPLITHVWSDFRNFGAADTSPESVRVRFARETWWKEGGAIDCEMQEKDCFRTSDKTIGDKRKMPYIKDIVAFAIEKKLPSDIICISNSDICHTPGLAGWIVEAVERHGAAWCQRWDSLVPIRKPLLNEADVAKLTFYDGADLFAFSRQWWEQHKAEFPDMILGAECWDGAMRQLMKLHGGVEIRKGIYHQKHQSYWIVHHKDNPANNHNRALYAKWLDGHRQFKWMDVIPDRTPACTI